MNKIKTGFITLLSLVPLAACLSGCGSEPRADIIFWHCSNKDVEAKLIKKADAFKQLIKDNTGKEISISLAKYGNYDQIKDKIEKGMTVGNIPTMAVAYPDHVANYLEKEENDAGKYVYKLDDFMTDPEIGFGKQKYLGDNPENPNDFFEAFMDEGRHYKRAGTYSLPFMKSTEVLYYNLELLKGFLAINPETKEIAASDDLIKAYMRSISWEDFLDLCTFINSHKLDPSAPSNHLERILGYDSDSNFFITKLLQNGIDYSSITSAGKGQIDFEKSVDLDNFNATRDMLKELKQYYDAGVLITKHTNSEKYSSTDFTEQKVLFTVGSSGGADYNEPGGGNFTVGVSAVPYSNDSPQWVSQGVTLAFMRNSTLSDEINEKSMRLSWQFAKYLTNPDVNVEMCFISSGYFPVREAALETEAWAALEDDPDSIRTKTYKIMTEDIDGKYFNTAIFKGSAELRTQVGTLLAEVLLKENATDKDIEDIITKNCDLAKNYF